MPVLDTFLDAMGDTPLVRLHTVTRGVRSTVLAKLEMLNPGGSVKDRIGIRMIQAAERDGLLKPGGTIVEPTSGNTGHGLAIAAAIRGYKCIFVMPDKMSQEKISLLRAYGAEVVICPTAVPPESPESYYRVADRLAEEIPGAYQPNQYFNPENPATHYETTGPEIWRQTDGAIDVFVAGVGTGGTITGVGRYLKEQNPDVIDRRRRSGRIGLLRRRAAPVPRRRHRRGLLAGHVRSLDRRSLRQGVGSRFVPHGARRHPTGGHPDRRLGGQRRVRRVAGRARARRDEDDRRAAARYRTAVPVQGVLRLVDVATRHARPSRCDPRRGGPDGQARRAPAVDHGRRARQGAPGGRAAAGSDISQAPVVREESTDVSQFVGSIRDRELLDRIFRDPDALQADVAEVMAPPIPMVEFDDPIESAFGELEHGPAVLVTKAGQVLGVLTRSDLLDFLAHRQRTP